MGYKIREARKHAGMTQEALSKKAKVSRTILSGLESGRISVTTTDTLQKIAWAMGMEVSDIFFD